MKQVTADTLRGLVADAIAPTIELHRASRSDQACDGYIPPAGAPTDEEIDEFLFHNPLLDEETIEQLVDPGLLGYSAKTARATDEWLNEFREHILAWAEVDPEIWTSAFMLEFGPHFNRSGGSEHGQEGEDGTDGGGGEWSRGGLQSADCVGGAQGRQVAE